MDRLDDLAKLPPDEAMRRLGSGPDGLSPEEAEARLRLHGPNEMPQPKGRSLLRQLADQLTHFFALLLWAAAALAWIASMPELAVAIVVVVIVNGLFSFLQEWRAERATRALAALLPEGAVAIRGGLRTRAPLREIVPGDLLVLREGDRIAADGVVLRSERLMADESTLTGESIPVEREPGGVVRAGTWAVSGTGLILAVATGASTALGSIAALTGGVRRRPTPLHRSLQRAVRTIAASAVTVGLVFAALSVALGMSLRDALLFGVGAIVALVPEGLLPTITLSLAMGAHRMARRRALVRRLDAVENLGAVTVICTDKTGTLTANQQTASALRCAGQAYRVTGVGFSPHGAILRDERPPTEGERSALAPLLHVAALCGDARIEPRDGRWIPHGDPTEVALVVLATKAGVPPTEEARRARRIRELPFEATRRRMSTVHLLPDGGHELLVKGSPEELLSRSTLHWDGARAVPFTEAARSEIRTEIDRLAAEGLRVIACARRHLHGGEGGPEELERELTFLGLVGIADPIRPESAPAIARCREAGIRVLMITGDHPATAAVVAREAGLPNEPPITGGDLPSDDAELRRLLAGPVSVIARVAPEQKQRIAAALQANGAVVAMTGDGVNDAPALRQADVGIAMGQGGTDVAREAADLVLLDDNFAHIVDACEEGRAAFANIRRFLTYHLTDNVAELAPFVAWVGSGGSIPLALSVLQILALDIGTDLLPALALGAEAPAPDVMRKPPRPPGKRLLDRGILLRAFGFLGILEALISLAMLPVGAAIFFDWQRGTPLPTAQISFLSTLVFASIVLMQMANALECRSASRSIFQVGLFSNRLLVAAIAVEAVALLAFVYVPGIRHVLGQQPLPPGAWPLLLLAPLLFLAAEEGRKALVRQLRPRR